LSAPVTLLYRFAVAPSTPGDRRKVLTEVSEQPDKIRETIPVAGMTCSGCARTLEVEFRKFENIDFSVNFPEGDIVVTYDPAEYDREAFERAIESHGYRIGRQ
jgi:copper chaperone CopZ